MNISIGMKLVKGPWGGGNQFGLALSSYLQDHGHSVSYDLKDPGLDLILLAEPRKNLQISAYSEIDIFKYLLRNPQAMVVHRINECDERKGTSGVNARLVKASSCSDHTVFIASWLMELFNKLGIPAKKSSVILNGGDASIFNRDGHMEWDGTGPLKLVTHHWSSHQNKGFDIYFRLDELLGKEPYKNLFSFTYIGNIPEGSDFKNTTVVEPLHGAALAEQLKKNHVYLTASRFEPGGMHHIEGALCGLPLVYINSGSLPEYCADYGLEFNPQNFEDILQTIPNAYADLKQKIKSYDHTAQNSCAEYLKLFELLVKDRERIIRQRPRFRFMKRLFS